MRILIFFATLLFLSLVVSGVNSAIIKGTIYNENLEPEKNSIVEINTKPIQKIVSVEGNYSFNVPLGKYVLLAVSGNNYDVQKIDVVQDGEYTLDLILLPGLGDLNLSELEEIVIDIDKERNPLSVVYLILGIILIFTGIYFYITYKKIGSLAQSKKAIPKASEKIELAEDLSKIVSFIAGKGGRINQKDITDEFAWSEAKVSLALAELEAMGVVKKIKKGRANIIILQKQS
jgi:uncharacterized membrane protein